jgi:hypothetical protein
MGTQRYVADLAAELSQRIVSRVVTTAEEYVAVRAGGRWRGRG